MVGSAWQDSRAAAGEEWRKSALKELIHNSMKQEGDYKRNKTEVQVQSGQDGHLHSFPYFYTFTWKYVIFFHILKFTFKTLVHLWWEIKQEETQPKKKPPNPPLQTPQQLDYVTVYIKILIICPLISMFCN